MSISSISSVPLTSASSRLDTDELSDVEGDDAEHRPKQPSSRKADSNAGSGDHSDSEQECFSMQPRAAKRKLHIPTSCASKSINSFKK